LRKNLIDRRFPNLGLVGAGNWSVSHTADFNGDGKADILFRNDDGSVTLWLMNGLSPISQVGLLGADPNWRVTHVGDFNGDGKADLLWQNTNGAVTLWLMNGITVLSQVGMLGPDPSWKVTHVADFNGDGKADLLWQNTNGAVTIWLMNGGTTASAVGILGANPDWRVTHTADLNGDGKADLLWRNTSGAVTTWLMNGTTIASTAGLLGADANWSVSHTGDFNGDGKADLVWRNTNGAVTQWLMNGTSILSTAGLLGPDANWRVTHIGDYNGDGKADIVWRNTADGSIRMWLIDGATVLSQTPILGASPWVVLPPPAALILPVSVVTALGGSNYNWYRVTFAGSECSWVPYGIIKNYHSLTPEATSTVRAVVQSQLAQMFSSGQRRLRIGLYFSRDPFENDGTTVMIQGSLPAQIKANLANYLADIRSAGFSEIIIGLFPLGTSYNFREWSVYNSTYVNEYSAIIDDVKSISTASGLQNYIDLANESMPFSSSNGPWTQAAQTIWNSYVAKYGASGSVGFSVSFGSGINVNRISTIYGGSLPSAIDIHLYDTSGSGREGQMLAEADQALDSQGYSSLPLIIGETYYNDPLTSASIRSAIPSTGRTVKYLLQWPLSRSGSLTASCRDNNVIAPMTGWANYSSLGF
jgi:hypothetical protein